MACFTSDVCTKTYLQNFCPQSKPINSTQSPNRCNASDYIKLKKDLTMNKHAISHNYPTKYRSYEFRSNLLWGKYVNDTICLRKCNCVFLY